MPILIILGFSIISILTIGLILKKISHRKQINSLKYGDEVSLYGIKGTYLGKVTNVSHLILGEDKIKYTVFEDDIII